jgi:queuine/archaeosine tRNA-ribosyltransferase
MAREILAHRLLTEHNLWFYQSLMKGARKAVLGGCYPTWSADVLRALEAGAPVPA